MTLLAFLPTRRNTIPGVELPLGSCVPGGEAPTFARGWLGRGSHSDVKEEWGLARVPYAGGGGNGIFQAEGIATHTKAEAGENLPCWVDYGGSKYDWSTVLQTAKLQRILEMDGGDGYTTVWVYLMLLSCTKVVKMVSFTSVVCFLPQSIVCLEHKVERRASWQLGGREAV